jgi:OOP family OmpA-OmpF porin
MKLVVKLVGILAASSAGVLLTAPFCSAQGTDPRFAVDRFEPAERGSEWFANESLDLRGTRSRPSIGVVGAISSQPVIRQNADGSIRESIVRSLFALHLGGSVVLINRLRLALDMPFQLFADGTSVIAKGRAFPAPSNEQGVGDLRVGADVRVFGKHRGLVTGALGLQAWAPTGQQSQWASDGAGGIRLRPRAMVAGTDRIFVYSAQISLGYRARTESFEPKGGVIGSDAGAAVALGVRLLDQVVIGPEAFASTVLRGDHAFSKESSSIEALFGGHWLIAETIRVGAGFGRGFTAAIGSPEQRFFFSTEWSPAMLSHDTDRDGIVDEDDACPLAVGIHTSDRKTNGCPSDRDRDGIADAEDACVDVPGIRSISYPTENGCPSDRDHDGVWDTSDACPDRRGVKTTDPLTNGCPPDADHDGVPDEVDACGNVPGVPTNDPKTNGCPPDTDGDGIDDLSDACPTAPGIKTQDPKTHGCPDPDRDKDGIPNDVDACPNDPGPSDLDPKRNGCPKAFVRHKQIEILEQVKFRAGSADIVNEGKDGGGGGGDSVLDVVLKILVDHPEIKLLRIEGHTDNRGGVAVQNTKLSSDRAASVLKWLVAHGIDASRLTSVGFGSEKPIDTNETELGRSNNRRIELHLVD